MPHSFYYRNKSDFFNSDFYFSIEISKTLGKINGTVEFFAREIDEFKDSTAVFKRKFN